MSEKSYIRLLPVNLWFRDNLPHGGFFISDLDGIIWDAYNNKLALIENKYYHGQMKEWQSRLFLIEDKIHKIGCEKLGIDYQGFYRINSQMMIRGNKNDSDYFRELKAELTRKSKELHDRLILRDFKICKIGEKLEAVDEKELIKILSLGRIK